MLSTLLFLSVDPDVDVGVIHGLQHGVIISSGSAGEVAHQHQEREEPEQEDEPDHEVPGTNQVKLNFPSNQNQSCISAPLRL